MQLSDKLTNGGFRKLPCRDEINGHKLRKYHLDNTGDDSTVRAYTTLMNARNLKNRVLFFPTNQDLFQATVKQKPYLIKIGCALFLLKSIAHILKESHQFFDHYITFEVFQDPIRCQHKHLLEGEMVRKWIEDNGTCPGPFPHPVQVADLQEDSDLRARIKAWQKSCTDLINQIDTLYCQRINNLTRRIDQLEAINRNTKIELG